MSNRIVFTRAVPYQDPNRPVADIYTMNPDGTGITRLTSNPADQEWDCAFPAWSPDCTKIAFAGILDRPQHTDIFVMDASGANRMRLTSLTGDNDDPTWSPDGHQIVFGSDNGSGKTALYCVDADGANLQLLTNSQFPDYQPTWRGTQIAFVRELTPYPNRLTEVFVVNADGTGERQLTSFGCVIFDLAWSPDGSRLAFSANKDDPAHFDIYSVDATTGGSLVRHTPGGAEYVAPCYSPSGTQIVLASNRGGGTSKIYVLDLGSDSWLQLTSGTPEDAAPDWR